MTESPETVVATILDVLRAHRWDEALGLLDPEESSAFRAGVLSYLGTLQSSADPDLAGVREWASAHWQAPSLASAETLPTAWLFARWMDATVLPDILDEGPGMLEGVDRVHRTLLGHVREGDRAHVVYREHRTPPDRPAPQEPGRLRVVSLVLRQDGWRLTWDEDLVLRRGAFVRP